MFNKRLAVLASISLALFGVAALTVYASPETQEHSMPSITVTAAQTPVIEGDTTTWHVAISPPEGITVANIALIPLGNKWTWLEDVQSITVVTNTIVEDISVAPMAQGDLLPILKASFTVEGEEHSLLVVGEMAVTVTPITNYLRANIITGQGVVQKNEPLPIEVWIDNQSPFTVTLTEIIGSGAGLEWEKYALQPNIPPYSVFDHTLSPIVIGRNPQPTINIIYGWNDAGGQPHTGSLNVSGQLVPLAERIILTNFESAMYGVLVGALATFGSQWGLAKRAERQQHKQEQKQVCSILVRLSRQAQHAAAHGSQVDLEILKRIFENGGLYAAAQKNELVEYVHELWSAAESHNDGLQKSGGLERLNELQDAAKNLREKLETIDACIKQKE